MSSIGDIWMNAKGRIRNGQNVQSRYGWTLGESAVLNIPVNRSPNTRRGSSLRLIPMVTTSISATTAAEASSIMPIILLPPLPPPPAPLMLRLLLLPPLLLMLLKLLPPPPPPTTTTTTTTTYSKTSNTITVS